SLIWAEMLEPSSPPSRAWKTERPWRRRRLASALESVVFPLPSIPSNAISMAHALSMCNAQFFHGAHASASLKRLYWTAPQVLCQFGRRGGPGARRPHRAFVAQDHRCAVQTQDALQTRPSAESEFSNFE